MQALLLALYVTIVLNRFDVGDSLFVETAAKWQQMANILLFKGTRNQPPSPTPTPSPPSTIRHTRGVLFVCDSRPLLAPNRISGRDYKAK